MQLSKKVSILMPGYNEGKHIYKNLLETEKVIEEFISEFEIIFINDGSNDNTFEEAKKASKVSDRILIVDLEKNSGKGNALKMGFNFCSGDYVAFVDSDLELYPDQLKGFLDKMEEESWDVVIGSKLHPNSVTNYPKQRKIISIGYYLMLKILFRLPLKDTQTGLKLFKYDVLKTIFPRILVKKFAFDIELLVNVQHKGYTIVEAPIKLDFRRLEKWGRIRIKDIIYVFIDTLAIFYRMFILRYYDKPIQDILDTAYSEIASTSEDGIVHIKEE